MTSTDKQRNKYGCLVCAEFSEAQPGLCSISKHEYGELTLNQKKTAYLGFYGQCFAHLDCIKKYLDGEDCKDKCGVCKQLIDNPSEAMKLALYLYRKKGCYAVMPIHDNCFREIGSKSKVSPMKPKPIKIGG